jgi:hypothetical protein
MVIGPISGVEHDQNTSCRVPEAIMGAHSLNCIEPHLIRHEQFKTRAKPSFRNMDQMFGWLSSLPQGAQWKSTKIDIKGFEMVQDANLIWHDGLEVVRDLFSNPMFANYMMYDPHTVKCGTECKYSEFFTGTRAFAIQVSSQDTVGANH